MILNARIYATVLRDLRAMSDTIKIRKQLHSTVTLYQLDNLLLHPIVSLNFHVCLNPFLVASLLATLLLSLDESRV